MLSEAAVGPVEGAMELGVMVGALVGALVGAFVHGTFFFFIIFPGTVQNFNDLGFTIIIMSFLSLSRASPRTLGESLLDRHSAGSAVMERTDRRATMQVFIVATAIGTVKGMNDRRWNSVTCDQQAHQEDV